MHLIVNAYQLTPHQAVLPVGVVPYGLQREPTQGAVQDLSGPSYRPSHLRENESKTSSTNTNNHFVDNSGKSKSEEQRHDNTVQSSYQRASESVSANNRAEADINSVVLGMSNMKVVKKTDPKVKGHSEASEQIADEVLREVELGVPDNTVPRILGFRGSGIRKLVQATGCTKIRVSQRDQFIEGTEDRIVYCTGTQKVHSHHTQYSAHT